MAKVKNPYVIIPIVASIIVGIMLPPSAAERHGVVKSIMFTMLAILVIWFCFFWLGLVIGRIVEDEVKKKEEEHNKNFV